MLKVECQIIELNTEVEELKATEDGAGVGVIDQPGQTMLTNGGLCDLLTPRQCNVHIKAGGARPLQAAIEKSRNQDCELIFIS